MDFWLSRMDSHPLQSLSGFKPGKMTQSSSLPTKPKE